MSHSPEKKSLPQELIDSIRPIMWRTDPDFEQKAGVGRRRIANMDSEGTGPAERVVMGRNKVGYPKAAFVEWLESRMRVEAAKPRKSADSLPDQAA